MNKRIDYIDIVRGICIIYMVAGHIDFNSPNFDHYIHAFHMPIFYIVSGYFYKNNNKQIKGKVISLIKKLLVPYFIWSLIAVIINNYTILGTNTGVIHDLKIIITTNNDVIPIIGALWFLTSFFFCNLFYIILKSIIKDQRLFLIATIIIMIIGIYLNKILNINLWWSLNSSLVGVGLMSLGGIIKKTNILDKLTIKSNTLLLIYFIINTFIIMKTGYVNMRTNTYPSLSLFLINLLMSFILYVNISKKMNNNKYISFINTQIKLLGKESIISLCLNQVVILIITTLYNNYLNKFIFSENSYIIISTRFIFLLISIVILIILTKVITKTRLKALFGK